MTPGEPEAPAAAAGGNRDGTDSERWCQLQPVATKGTSAATHSAHDRMNE